MNVYDMKLHDVLWLNLSNTEVLRVPGGWIYRVYDSVTQHECLNSCFVPFDNQFMGTPEGSGAVANGEQQANTAICPECNGHPVCNGIGGELETCGRCHGTGKQQ